MGLTGTKKGCDVGECGSCTILFNGHPANACLILAAEAQGAEITTVEGLQGADGKLHPSAGMLYAMRRGAMRLLHTRHSCRSAKALLDENPCPSTEDIRFAIAGNICRCTGYTKILDAITAPPPSHRRPAHHEPKSIIGTSVKKRNDLLAKVTGDAKYVG